MSSCAGIIGGKTQNIYLIPNDYDSDNVEVEVSNGKGMRQTVEIPLSIQVQRSESPLIIKVKENKCYKSTKTYVSSQYNPMLLANVPGGIFGLTGTAIDMDSGAAWGYDQTVRVSLKKKRYCK
ncbi:hypothetical protein N8772_02750 [Rickettsiales bacterium]|nr:hypothetical protein [Rickettsiales bacterium]